MSQPLLLASDTRLIKLCDRIIEFCLLLLLLFLPLFFLIITRDQFELPKLTILRTLTAVMLGAWGVRIVAARRLDWKPTPLDLPLGVWVLLQFVTTIFSVSRSVSLLGEYENFRGLLTVLNYALLYYLGVHFIRTRAQIDRVLLIILLAGLLTTAYGIAQFFGIDFIAWNPTSIAAGRYFSSLGNPNFLAAYLAMVMPLLVIFFVETKSRFRRVLLFVSFVAMFLCLLGTWSRGGFLGLLVGLVGLVYFGLQKAGEHIQGESQRRQLSWWQSLAFDIRRHPGLSLLVGFTLVLLGLLSATLGRHHMQRMADSILHLPQAITTSRLHIWGPALGIIRANPLLGTGLDTFKTVFPRYATPAFAAIDGANVASRTAHNEILQVLATQGIVGLIIVAWLTVAFLRVWWRAYVSSAGRWRDRLILVGLFGSWLSYSVQNVFSFGVAAIDTFYWLILAITVLMSVSPEEQAKTALPQTPDPNPSGFWRTLSRFRVPAMAVIAAAAGFLILLSWKIFVADVAYNLGTYFRLQNQWEPTVANFRRASQLVPLEVKYVVYEGLAYEERAKSSSEPEQQRKLILQAIAAYAKGVRLNPTNAYYLGNLGRAYALAADLFPDHPEYYTQAVEHHRRSLEYAPVTVLFYQNLALLYLTHHDEANFRSVTDALGKFDAFEAARLEFTAGNGFYNQQNLARALEYYDRALGHQPAYPEALFNRGVVLAQLGSVQPALGSWRRALELKPDFEPARQMLLRYERPGRVDAGHSILNP